MVPLDRDAVGRVRIRHRLAPVQIAARHHVGRAFGALEHDGEVRLVGGLVDGAVHQRLVWDHATRLQPAACGDDRAGLGVVDAHRQFVRGEIGPIASPDAIQFAPALPKTRSGKIMRRILRKIAEGEPDKVGDTSTLADPAVVDALIEGAVV